MLQLSLIFFCAIFYAAISSDGSSGSAEALYLPWNQKLMMLEAELEVARLSSIISKLLKNTHFFRQRSSTGAQSAAAEATASGTSYGNKERSEERMREEKMEKDDMEKMQVKKRSRFIMMNEQQRIKSQLLIRRLRNDEKSRTNLVKLRCFFNPVACF